jgi:glycosyltransferase involved in cell wall biosynthesis
MLQSSAGTGVTSYARTLAAAARRTGRDTGILSAVPGWPGVLGKATRGALASRRVVSVVDDGAGGLAGRDIFRLAQVRFALRGRVLELRAPGPPGIMHWTYPVPMAMMDWINVYTVHDAIPLAHPELTPIDGDRHRRLLETLRPFADRIVTVSEAARQDLVRSLGWPGDFITDLGLAVAPRDEGIGSFPAGLSRRGYLLFCGQIEPRKNLARLAEAYVRSGLTMPLVLVGPDGWHSQSILRQIDAVPGIVRLPYLDRATLLGLIANARALLLPSLAEGFGLPVAEAMALGTPVLVSRDPALVEVTQQAAIAVDGEDVEALAGALVRLASDDALCAALSARGLARAPAFSIDRFAERLDAFYTGLVARRA